MCGDFNARCVALYDYISGIDNISGREILDFRLNKHCSIMTDFLIDSNCCMLNGRNHIGNNFTLLALRPVLWSTSASCPMNISDG